jgi:hypothetical protein
MALINSLSKPAIRGEVELFSVPATDTTTDYSMYSEFQPLVNVRDSSSKIEFKIPGNGNHYLDLNDNFLYILVKVVAKDGSDLADDAKVGVTNLFMHALFSQLDVYFNSQLVSTSNNVYPYRAYIETLLSYGSDYKSSQGTCALFYTDTGDGGATTGNTGYTKRKSFIHKSKTLELMDKLRFNLATQHRYILNDVTVNINLTRSPDSFSLFTESSTDEAVVKIMSASLFVRKQILYPSLILSHQKLLEKGQVARYPHKKTEVKYFTIATGSSGAVEENLFANSIPSRVVIGFIPSQAFVGQFHSNPFKFNHTNVTSIGITINNISIPIRPLALKFSEDQFLQAYYLLFTSTGIAGQDIGLSFDREDFKENNALFTFDIVQACGNESLLSLEKSGSVKLEVLFGTALASATHCVVFSEHQAILEIDKFRQVVVTQ